MAGCLKGVVPGSQLNTMWASTWSSKTFLPTLWAIDGMLSGKQWSFIGGTNVCGAYCTAWGCGPSQDQHYNQSACGTV